MSPVDDASDASVVFTARQRRLRVLSSDPDDLRTIDERLDIVGV